MTDPAEKVFGTGSFSHGGDIYRKNVKRDFSVSLNPLGMPEQVKKALEESVPEWSAYPDPFCGALRHELSAKLEVGEDEIAFGNGAAELIYDLVSYLKPARALVCTPSFSEYDKALDLAECEVSFFPLSHEERFHLDASAFAGAIEEGMDLVFLCNPNNPTGECLLKEEVRKIERACRKRHALLCVDETFVELTENPDKYSVLKDCGSEPGLCVLRAFTKTYALAGLRLGYMVSGDKALISGIDSVRQPWSVSAPAHTAGLAALTKVPSSYLDEARCLIASERERMSEELSKRGFEVIPSQADFILFYSTYTDLAERCLEKGILIRDCRNFAGLGQGYYRIGLRTKEDDDMFLRVLDEVMKQRPC